MDPVTIILTVARASAAGVSTAKAASTLQTHYKDAPTYIAGICAELGVTVIALCVLENMARQPRLSQILRCQPQLTIGLATGMGVAW
ncbi:hypothetical protein BCR34DRAFT_598649 [Clohesyomyces aquaticus]|uniref:Uncharacterized protein n=1 Tax=Clohesyomyces aquaticus TaxID=1231657 RepID=A0A1Y1ZZH2_9PLEO|nr:hypothetical protein BCR34DRAFT_598649 [Clohesyomyces aquaticus]